MRIACLQFAPKLGDIDNNLNRADAVLSKANPSDLDLLVLPELAFTGKSQLALQRVARPRFQSKLYHRAYAMSNLCRIVNMTCRFQLQIASAHHALS
jgi:predicted amidohydrolase